MQMIFSSHSILDFNFQIQKNINLIHLIPLNFYRKEYPFLLLEEFVHLIFLEFFFNFGMAKFQIVHQTTFSLIDIFEPTLLLEDEDPLN